MFLLRGWPLIPVMFLLIPALRRSPAFYGDAGEVLGFDATLCLVACISITPLMTVMRARVAALRWWYGVWMFTLGAAGLMLEVVRQPAHPLADAAGTSVNWTGLLIVVLLAPMTITSNAVAQRLLGPEWKRWQRTLVWVVWALVAIHLVALQSWLAASAFGMATVPLMVLRWRVKAIKAWRRGGYSTGGWWLALAVLVTTYGSGVVILVAELGSACARTAA